MAHYRANYYRVLGVSAEADARTIKRAYRQLAKEMHPDVNPHDPHAEQLFQRLVEAYEVLRDDQRRAAYDLALQQAEVPQTVQDEPMQEVWHTYVGMITGQRDEVRPPRHQMQLWLELPLMHYFLSGSALLVAGWLMWTQGMDAVGLVLVLACTVVVSSWWLYRMHASWLTAHRKPSLVEMVLIYCISGIISGLLSVPLTTALLLGSALR